MKRFLFVVVFLISFSAKADTGKICTVYHSGSNLAFFDEVKEECKKDDALTLTFNRLDYNFLENIDFIIAKVCRLDREIHYFFYDDKRTTGRLTCAFSGLRQYRN